MEDRLELHIDHLIERFPKLIECRILSRIIVLWEFIIHYFE